MPRPSTQSTYYSGSVQHASPMNGHGNVKSVSVPTQAAQLSGLYVFGEVTDRTRRTVPTRDNSNAEIVTYTIQDTAGHRYFIDEYSPQRYNDIGTVVEIPVYVRTFKKRNGDVGHSFGVQQQLTISTRGERF